MDLSWGNDVTERACTVAEAGVAAWGDAGQRVVAETFAVVSAARVLADLVAFSARFGLARLGSTPVVVIAYRAVEILAWPYHSRLGALTVPSAAERMDSIHHADRLAVHDVRCHGRPARQEGAA